MIGITVLNYNCWALTIKCVDNLIAVSTDLQIVVVDNASTDNSVIKLHRKYDSNTNVVVLENDQNHGYAAGNNIGLKYLNYNFPLIKYYCVINPDVIVESEFVFNQLSKMLDEDEKLAAISPVMILNGFIDNGLCCWEIPTKKEVWIDHSILFNKTKTSGVIEMNTGLKHCEAIPGSFFMIKKNVLEKIDFLDEGTFLYNEENILAIRIKRLGMYSAIDTSCTYLHNHVKSCKRLPLKKVMAGAMAGNQSRLYMAKTYYDNFTYQCVKIICFVNYPLIIIRHILGDIKRIIIK